MSVLCPVEGSGEDEDERPMAAGDVRVSDRAPGRLRPAYGGPGQRVGARAGGGAARGRAGGQPTTLRSPEVHADRTITFRLRAPQATSVELVGEVTQGKGP